MPLPRSDAQFEEIRALRKDNILRAAGRVFARKGYAATRIADIAAEVSISQGLLYRYYAGKEEVYRAAVERAMNGAILLVRAANQRVSPWEGIAWMLQRALEGLRQESDFAPIILEGLRQEAIPADLRSDLATWGQEVQRDLAALIRRGQEAGEVASGDPKRLAAVLLASLQGLALQSSRGHSVDHRDTAAILLRLLRPDGPQDALPLKRKGSEVP